MQFVCQLAHSSFLGYLVSDPSACVIVFTFSDCIVSFCDSEDTGLFKSSNALSCIEFGSELKDNDNSESPGCSEWTGVDDPG